MKKTLALLAVTLSSLVTAQSVSIPGTGSSGGGHGITQDDKVALRELVEGVICDWKMGPFFARQHKQFQKLDYLIRFMAGDQAFANRLESEIIRLKVCMSKSPLKTLPESLHESVAVYQDSNVGDSEDETFPLQIAVRIGTELYIDADLYEKMDEKDQGYLILHELLHGFIPMNVAGRMTKLRDFVSGMREIEASFPEKITDIASRYVITSVPEDLAHLDLAQEKLRRLKTYNSVGDNFPITVDEAVDLVDRYKYEGYPHYVHKVFGWGLDPNSVGKSGQSLFIELIWDIRRCREEDKRGICFKAKDLLFLYLNAGADGDAVFNNNEGWTPRPVWEYLLTSAFMRGYWSRLDYADTILKNVISKKYSGKVEGEILDRMNELLHLLSREPYASRSIKVLVDNGANVNSLNEKGQPALIAAASIPAGEPIPFRMYMNTRPPAENIIQLLKGGADVDAKWNGQTAYDILWKQYSKVRTSLDPMDQKLFDISFDLLREGKEAIPQAEKEIEAL